MKPPTELNIYSVESRYIIGILVYHTKVHDLISLVSSNVHLYSKCGNVRFGGIRLGTHDKQIPVDSRSILV